MAAIDSILTTEQYQTQQANAIYKDGTIACNYICFNCWVSSTIKDLPRNYVLNFIHYCYYISIIYLVFFNYIVNFQKFHN